MPNETIGELLRKRSNRNENVIMIADDDMFIRKILATSLSEYATIVEVDDGRDVIQAYKDSNPDFVILDIHMPYHDGLFLLTEIKELDHGGFIVMTSSDGRRENLLEATERGAKGFLRKPIQKQKILDLFSECATFSQV